MCRASVTDPYIQSIPALFQAQASREEIRHFLQTSPEYAMKRLLAAGSGAIFQISKAFRQGEIGHHHNPEFSMIEWYRPGFTHHDLMNEVDELLQFVLDKPAAERKTYAELFMQYLHIDPHTVSVDELAACARKNNISVAGEIEDADTWLQILMSEYIEPRIGQDRPCFVYDFPASQAALARVIPGNPPTASRFEVYYRGIELANGFHELQDAGEQRKRFEKNVMQRRQAALNEMMIDEFFLSALEHGLPDCAGVALGVDRLVMLACECGKIADVLSFDFARV
jgi:lysyl-tRNA synthetase class 2